MKHIMGNQRGTAVLEVLLLAVVVAVMGYVGLKAYQNRPSQSPTAVSVPAVTATAATPSGSVDNAVTALNNDAGAESAASADNSAEASQVTVTSSAASNIGGSFNENSY